MEDHLPLTSPQYKYQLQQLPEQSSVNYSKHAKHSLEIQCDPTLADTSLRIGNYQTKIRPSSGLHQSDRNRIDNLEQMKKNSVQHEDPGELDFSFARGGPASPGTGKGLISNQNVVGFDTPCQSMKLTTKSKFSRKSRPNTALSKRSGLTKSSLRRQPRKKRKPSEFSGRGKRAQQNSVLTKRKEPLKLKSFKPPPPSLGFGSSNIRMLSPQPIIPPAVLGSRKVSKFPKPRARIRKKTHTPSVVKSILSTTQPTTLVQPTACQTSIPESAEGTGVKQSGVKGAGGKMTIETSTIEVEDLQIFDPLNKESKSEIDTPNQEGENSKVQPPKLDEYFSMKSGKIQIRNTYVPNLKKKFAQKISTDIQSKYKKSESPFMRMMNAKIREKRTQSVSFKIEPFSAPIKTPAIKKFNLLATKNSARAGSCSSKSSLTPISQSSTHRSHNSQASHASHNSKMSKGSQHRSHRSKSSHSSTGSKQIRLKFNSKTKSQHGSSGHSNPKSILSQLNKIKNVALCLQSNPNAYNELKGGLASLVNLSKMNMIAQRRSSVKSVTSKKSSTTTMRRCNGHQDSEEDLRGKLDQLSQHNDVRYTIEGNVFRMYPKGTKRNKPNRTTNIVPTCTHMFHSPKVKNRYLYAHKDKFKPQRIINHERDKSLPDEDEQIHGKGVKVRLKKYINDDWNKIPEVEYFSKRYKPLNSTIQSRSQSTLHNMTSLQDSPSRQVEVEGTRERLTKKQRKRQKQRQHSEHVKSLLKSPKYLQMLAQEKGHRSYKTKSHQDGCGSQK